MSDLQRLAADLSAVMEPTFERLERIADVVRAARGAPGRWSEADLAPVQEVITELIAVDDLTVGMGFVAAPLVVAGHERAMLWWQRNDGRTTRLRLNFDRSSIDVYDYVEMEWYQLAAAGRGRVTMGPYVDYSGSELYIVTASVPVVVGDTFVGIAGADVLFSELERRLVAVVRDAPGDVVVVSAERRVIVANSPRWVPGARLPQAPAVGDDFAAVEPLPLGGGWTLCLASEGGG